jgi:hypothetical protein
MRTHHDPLQDEHATHHSEDHRQVKEDLTQHFRATSFLDRPFFRRPPGKVVAFGFDHSTSPDEV